MTAAARRRRASGRSRFGPKPAGPGRAARRLAAGLAVLLLMGPAAPLCAAGAPGAVSCGAAARPANAVSLYPAEEPPEAASGRPVGEPDGLLAAGPPELLAGSYILMDAATGQVLAQKDADSVRYPASTTKLMTLALVLESCGEELAAELTVSESAVAAMGPDSSSIFLRPGETISLADAIWAAELESANDAANLLAEYAAGSIGAFVARMNQKAAELGLENTRFANPSGYHDDGHYTTARELALITRWALSVPGFSELLGGVKYTMPGNPVHPAERQMLTDNRLLLDDPPYPGLLGGKTGWTPEAHFTLVEVAGRGRHTLIAVTLACPRKDVRFSECAALLDYGFEQFAPVQVDAAALGLAPLPVVQNGKKLGEVPLDAAAELLLPAGEAGPLTVRYVGPEQYNPDEPFAAQAQVYTSSGRLLAVLDAVPRQETLDRILQTQRHAAPWDLRGLQPIMFLAFFIVTGAALLNLGSLHFVGLRRNAASRRLHRMRERGLARIGELERAARGDEAGETPAGPEEKANMGAKGPRIG